MPSGLAFRAPEQRRSAGRSSTRTATTSRATVDQIRPGYSFDVTCQRTVPEALTCALESVSYEDAVRNAVSLGGDADTLAAIAGPIAESLHGIPGELVTTAIHTHLSNAPDIVEVMERLYDDGG